MNFDVQFYNNNHKTLTNEAVIDILNTYILNILNGNNSFCIVTLTAELKGRRSSERFLYCNIDSGTIMARNPLTVFVL